ncbi:hypothetical protein DL98DRAFT_520435 [Cadophora sp. DSE1049]|nr:hypothetical protein DL98DRAFT_520435 [Cadophora sp. DSE1049]
MSSEPRPQLHKGQPYQPISGNGTRLQPHPVNQDTLTIDQRLHGANSAISESLNILSSNRETITSLTRACTTYQRQLEDWSKAYTDLETEHKKTSTDLENMSRNHNSLRAQLDEASQCYDLSVQQYKRELQAMNQWESREHQTALAQAHGMLTAAERELNEMREMKGEHQSDLRKAHGQLNTAQQNLDKLRKEKEDLVREHRDALVAAEDRAAIAKKRIIELEEQHSYERLSLGEKIIELEKKVDSIREHRDAMAGAWEAAEKKIAKLKEENANLIQDRDTLATAEEAAEKRIAELKKENSHLIQEHRDAFAAVEDQAIVVVERIAEPEKEKELENMHLTAESGASAADSPVASPETIPSPNTRKRPRFESLQGGVQQQYRKVRGRKAAKAIDGDTIIVQTE